MFALTDPPTHDRIAVWESMAEHFLDTETRQTLPRTALTCLHAGLGVEDARAVWRYEVTPAVHFNIWDIAGEWSGWDRTWLVARILSCRGRGLSRPGPLGWLTYRCRVHFNHCIEVAVVQLMEALIASPDPTRDASWMEVLAQHFFDCHASPLPDLAPSQREAFERVANRCIEIFPCTVTNYGDDRVESSMKRMRAAWSTALSTPCPLV